MPRCAHSCSAATWKRAGTSPLPATRHCSRPRMCFSRSLVSIRSPIFRPSPTSFPTRTWSRHSSEACASRRPSVPRRRATTHAAATPPVMMAREKPATDEVAPAPPERGERLQKYLARAGVGSRRACETLITDGRVTIDGCTARLGDRVRTGQRVALEGMPVAPDGELVYYLLNKPGGVVTTAD